MRAVIVFALLAAVSLSSGTAHAQAILFVDDDAVAGGDGMSWATAFNDLQDALDQAGSNTSVQEIWVAAGLYRPDRGTADQSLSFVMVDGVAVYGGFNGTETKLSQRDWHLNVTTLSGDLLENDEPFFVNVEDNSRTVVRASGSVDDARLDGFTVTGGISTDPNTSAAGAGGGIYLLGSNMAIANCTFTWNKADSGGACATIAASPTIHACVFEHNWATGQLNSAFSVGWGGAIYARQGILGISACHFDQNRSLEQPNGGSPAGGAIAIENASVEILGCVFSRNTAGNPPNGVGGRGGAIYAVDETGLPFDVMVSQCEFRLNIAHRGSGGAMYTDHPQQLTITECEFTSNQAEFTGGAIVARNTQLILSDSLFDQNAALTDWAGGVFVFETTATVTDCEFTNNRASKNGAGLASWGANTSTTAADCVFRNNRVTFAGVEAFGGALSVVHDASTDVVSCTFDINSSAYRGGAIGAIGNGVVRMYESQFNGNDSADSGGAVFVSVSTTVFIKECVFNANRAGVHGGAITNGQGSIVILDTTLRENEAQQDGGAAWISISSGGVGDIRRSVFLGNTSPGRGGGLKTGGDTTVDHCVFSGNLGGDGGGVWVSANPVADFRSTVFSANTALGRGGGVFAGGRPDFYNTIAWENEDSSGITLGAQIYSSAPHEVDLLYCCVQHLDGSFAGTGNIAAAPSFVSPLGADGIAGTVDDDLRLQPGSACIDAGDNDGVVADTYDLDDDGDMSEPTPFDLNDNSRFHDDHGVTDTGHGTAPIIDIGAFEFPDHTPRQINLTALDITFGSLLSGIVGRLTDSDDEYVETRSQFGFSAIEPNITEILIGADASGVDPPAVTFDVGIESRVNNPGCTATVKLRNWKTNALEEVHTYPLEQTDALEQITGVDATSHVRVSDGRVELAIRHSVIATFAAAGFDSFFDLVEIVASR